MATMKMIISFQVDVCTDYIVKLAILLFDMIITMYYYYKYK